jgi:phosphatidylglycerol lysyltransferase
VTVAATETEALRRPSAACPRPAFSPEAARDILRRHGRGPLSRIALLPSYRYYFAPGGRSVLAYADSGSLRLALGEPAGPAGAAGADAIREFAAHSRARGRRPVVVGVPRAGAEACRSAGLRVQRIGHEALLRLDGFSLEGGRRRSLRQSVNRARRAGARFEIWDPPITRAEVSALAGVSDAWLATRRLRERRFGAGWFHPEYLASGRVAVVRGRDGRIEAFANLLEGYSPDEASADLMRRRPGASPGAMDALFAGIAAVYRDEGKKVFNLGLAPLAGLGRGVDATRTERVFGWMYRRGGGLFSFAGLFAFKAKFRPEWEPRYVGYDPGAFLPRVLLAAADVRPGAEIRARGARWTVKALAALAFGGAGVGAGCTADSPI